MSFTSSDKFHAISFNINQSIVEDYLKEAKNHVPEAMKVMEDALLIWLAYSEYDTDKAIRSLID